MPEQGTHTKAQQDALVEEHLHLVSHVVNQVAARYPRHVDRAELWNAGAYGLVEASRRFDPTAGTPFARFAVTRIRGAIIDSTRSRDWVSRGARRQMRELRETTERFQMANGRDPQDGELADLLGVSTDQVVEVRAATERSTLLQLDQRVGAVDGEELTLGDLVTENDAASLPEDDLARRELIGAVRVAIDHLPETHREVLDRYYFAGEQLRDIADSFGLTEARISQLRHEAITAVRAYLGQAFGAVDEVDAAAPGARRRAAFLESMAEVTWRDCVDAADQVDQVIAVV